MPRRLLSSLPGGLFWSIPLAALVAALVQPSSAALAQSDQVFLARGRPVQGEITKTTPAEVTVTASDGPRTIAVNDIRRIQLGGETAELRRGRTAANEERYEDALSDLKKINLENKVRLVIRQEAQFYLAYCSGRLAMAGGGDKAAAVRELLKFTNDHGNSFHFYQASELIGDLAVSLGSYDNAVKYYKTVGEAPWPEYKMRAALLEGRALLAKGDTAAAEQRFDFVAAASLTTPTALRQKTLSLIGKARCRSAAGAPAEGVSLIEKVIQENEPSDIEVFGRAYNALGVCRLKEGQSKAALHAFMHVDILFFSEPDIHAESLYYLSKLWKELKKSDRSVDARTLLRQRYAGTPWAAKQ